MFGSRISKYNREGIWNDDWQLSSLKRENYNLTVEIANLKKKNDILQRQKTETENRLDVCIRANVKSQLPDDIEKLLDRISSDAVKTELCAKLKNLLNCITCVICNVNVKTVVYSECKHLIACSKCSDSLSDVCPLCRNNSKKISIFL